MDKEYTAEEELFLTNGVPVQNTLIDNNKVCSLLKKFTGKESNGLWQSVQNQTNVTFMYIILRYNIKSAKFAV